MSAAEGSPAEREQLHRNLQRMEVECGLADDRLRGLQDLHLATAQDVTEARSRADAIYLLAADTLLKMRTVEGEGNRPEAARHPVSYFADVYSMLHEARGHLEAGNMERFATVLFSIRSAMDAVRSIHPRVLDFNYASASSATRASSDAAHPRATSDTPGVSDVSSDAITVVSLKHFLLEGGIVCIKDHYPSLPVFAQLHDLGISLLSKHDLMVREFQLKLDDTVLRNNNTREELSKYKGSQVLILLTFVQRWSSSRVPPGSTQLISGQEKLLICIEGNIGSRKSDFMSKLVQINDHRQQSVTVIKEPTEKELADELAQFHRALKAGDSASDQEKEQSSRFEEKMFKHHLDVATKSQTRAMHVISERSMDSKIKVFNELNHERGLLLPKYRDNMQAQFSESISGHRQHQPHAVIFFESTVDEAMDRIKKRGRQGEAHINKEYLQAIEDKYDKLYPKEAANVIRVQPSEQPMEDLIVDVKDKLQATLRTSDFVSQAEIDEFLTFFQDERPEPSSV